MEQKERIGFYISGIIFLAIGIPTTALGLVGGIACLIFGFTNIYIGVLSK